MVNDSLIDQIINQVDIVEFISRDMELIKKGNNYVGLCPFHEDTKPSYTVNREKKYSKCFACNNGGNVISYYQKTRNVTFKEALRVLAKEIGVNFAKVEVKLQPEHELNQEILKYYQVVMKLEQVGLNARKYLESRNINEQMIEDFQFGFAPSDPGKLLTYLQEQTSITPSLVATQLGTKDQFYNRLMVPIFDDQGRVVGFSGRTLKNDNPKYLNSREDKIFRKKEILYNLNNAQKIDSKELIIVEGFFDVISLARLNIKNVVALMGTAFTDEHIKLIKKYRYETITFLLDQDNAGQKATIDAAEKLLAANMTDIKVINFGRFNDIDELINTATMEQANIVMKRRKSYFQYRIDYLRKQYDLNDIDEKTNFTKQALKHVSRLEVEKRLNVTQVVSQITQIDQNQINLMIDQEIKTPQVEVKKTVESKKTVSRIKVPTSNETIIKYGLQSKDNFNEIIFAFEQGVNVFDQNINDEIDYVEIFQILKKYYQYFDEYDYIDITDFIGDNQEISELLEKIRKEDINKFNFEKVPEFLKTGQKTMAIGNMYFKKRSKK